MTAKEAAEKFLKSLNAEVATIDSLKEYPAELYRYEDLLKWDNALDIVSDSVIRDETVRPTEKWEYVVLIQPERSNESIEIVQQLVSKHAAELFEGVIVECCLTAGSNAHGYNPIYAAATFKTQEVKQKNQGGTFSAAFRKSLSGNRPIYDAVLQIAMKNLPADVDTRYQWLRNNGFVARDEADINVYVVKVASRHIPKFKWLYSNLFRTYPEVFSKDLDVVVWGSGCGLDLLALYDQAMAQDNPQLWLTVRHVMLVDISAEALHRAEAIAKELFPTATIVAVTCDLKDPDEIRRKVHLRSLSAYVTRLHLISNLLDLFDNVGPFAEAIKECAGRSYNRQLYFNEFVVAFSPEYRGGVVARNFAQFRNMWQKYEYASEVTTIGDVPLNCEFCAFSYRTLLNDKCFKSYMRGRNHVLNQLVSQCQEVEPGFAFHDVVTALSKIKVFGKNFYKAYRWVEVGRFKNCIERLVFVSAPGDIPHPAPCVVELIRDNEQDYDNQNKEAVVRKRALKCLHERRMDDTAPLEGTKEDFVVLFWGGHGLTSKMGTDMASDEFWRYDGSVDYSLYFRIDPGGIDPLPSLEFMDAKQRDIIFSRAQYRKIRGGAGCGKSTTMMWHAVMAIKRTHLPVLLVCKTVTLFNHNAKRLAATLLGEFPQLSYVDSDFFEFMTLDKILCEHMRKRYCTLMRCIQCKGCTHNPEFRCNDYLPGGREWRQLSEDEKRRCCDICVKENIRNLSRKGSQAAENAKAFGAVLIDEVQSVDPELVQAVVNLTYGGNHTRECYVFCDERQSLNPKALEIDSEKKKLRVKVPDRGDGYGRWVDLNKPYRASRDFSGRLVDVAVKLQSLTIAKYGDVELAKIVGSGQRMLSGIVFTVLRSHGKLLDELLNGITAMKARGAGTITIICDRQDTVRDLLRDPLTHDWISTHLPMPSHVDEQKLRMSFRETENRIHLTTVTLAQGWDFQNVIFVCASDNTSEAKSVLENVLTGATRATGSMRILDRSKSGWLYDELKELNQN